MPSQPPEPSPRRALAHEVIALAWPAIVAGLVSTLVFFSDRLMLGHFSTTALGSMQIAGPVLWSVHSVFGAFSVGTLAVVGRATGAGDSASVGQTTTATLIFAGGIGAACAVAGLGLTDPISEAVGGAGAEGAALREAAATYMRIVFIASPLVFVAQAGTVALQATGDTATPMRISAVAAAVNVVVSAVLLFGLVGAPRLGVTGAALGTAAAFAVQSALVVSAIRSRNGLPLNALAATLGRLRPVLRIATPALGERLIFHTGFLLFAGIVGRLGPEANVANQSLIAIESVGFMAATGFGIASGTLVAQKLGAGRPADATACGWLSAGIGATTIGAVSLAFILVPDALVGLFTDDPDIVALGSRCLRVAAIAQPLMAIADALAGALRGAGDTRSPMVIALFGPVCVRLSACWLFAMVFELGLLGIWMGTTLDWAVRVTCLAWVFRRGRWRDRAAC